MVEDNEKPYSLEEEEEEEQPRRRRIRHYKQEEIMLQECHAYVMARKRLPLLHGRWLLNRYINCHNYEQASVAPHNHALDELREAQTTIRKLQQRIRELEQPEH